MVDERSLEWSAGEMLRNGEATLREAVRYLEDIRDRPVTTAVARREIDRLLDQDAPESPEDFDAILRDTMTRVVPHLAHWNHPRFHGYFSISGSFPGALAELLCACLNVNTMLWETAPAAVALEAIVLRWIAEIVDYPRDADSVIVPGASLATFYALAAARERRAPGIQRVGYKVNGSHDFRIYASDQAHSSVDKAASALGVGADNVVRIASDSDYRLSPDALRRALADDVRGGRTPLAVVATVGTTATGAVDPVEEIAAICREHEVWLHVDAAYGGLWSLLPEVRQHVGPLSGADSLVVNPHKGLFTAIGTSCLYCREPGGLSRAFRWVPDYLESSASELELDYMDRTLQLGRGFKALPLWWVIRSYGLAKIREHFRAMMSLARWLEVKLDGHPAFTRPAASIYPLVTFQFLPTSKDGRLARLGGPQGRTEWLSEVNVMFQRQVNATGKTFVTHAQLHGSRAIRVSIGNIRTGRADLHTLWSVFESVARDLDGDLMRAHGVGA